MKKFNYKIKREVMSNKSSFQLSSPRSYEEIMRRSASFVDDYTLGLQFPACDFGSYYLYATLCGNGPCQAINLGVTIGHDTGSNVGIPQLKGDPGAVWIVTSLICNNKSYRNFRFLPGTKGRMLSIQGRVLTCRLQMLQG